MISTFCFEIEESADRTSSDYLNNLELSITADTGIGIGRTVTLPVPGTLYVLAIVIDTLVEVSAAVKENGLASGVEADPT